MQELHLCALEVGTAIKITAFERKNGIAILIKRKPPIGYGRPGSVPAELFQAFAVVRENDAFGVQGIPL